MPFTNPPVRGQTGTWAELQALGAQLDESWQFNLSQDELGAVESDGFWYWDIHRQNCYPGPRYSSIPSGYDIRGERGDPTNETFVAVRRLMPDTLPLVGDLVQRNKLAWMGAAAHGYVLEVTDRYGGRFGKYTAHWIGPHSIGPAAGGMTPTDYGNILWMDPVPGEATLQPWYFSGQQYTFRVIALPEDNMPRLTAITPETPGCPVCMRSTGTGSTGNAHYAPPVQGRPLTYCDGWKIAKVFQLVELCPRCTEPAWKGSITGSLCTACRSRRGTIQVNGANPEDLRFGCEMETEGLLYSKQAGEVATKLRKGRPLEWDAKDDGSLRGECAEVVSPPLPFTPAGLAEMREGAKRLRNAGARTSPRCGSHIHVGCEDLTYKQIGSLAEWWYACQGVVVAAIPIIRSRQEYCRLFEAGNLANARSAVAGQSRPHLGSTTDKYCTLNFSHIGRVYNTVEFRLFNGTLHIGKLTAYATLVCHLVSKASRTIHNQQNPRPHYAASREGMVALLDDLEITDKSARYHLLGKFAVDTDLPQPEGFVPKPAKKRQPNLARPDKVYLGRFNVLMSGREYTRLGLGCGIHPVATLDECRWTVIEMNRLVLWADSNFNRHQADNSQFEGGRIQRSQSRNDYAVIAISRLDWEAAVTADRVALGPQPEAIPTQPSVPTSVQQGVANIRRAIDAHLEQW